MQNAGGSAECNKEEWQAAGGMKRATGEGKSGELSSEVRDKSRAEQAEQAEQGGLMGRGRRA